MIYYLNHARLRTDLKNKGRFSHVHEEDSKENQERADHFGVVPSELQLPRALPGSREGHEGCFRSWQEDVRVGHD